ncbi:MAG: hypothetical protein AB1716_14590 [Planctomycetota bacterium]
MLRRVASCAFALALLNAAFAQCPREWAAGYHAPGLGGPEAQALAFAAYDSGCGSELYIGGFFFTAGPAAARCLARWDGLNWSPCGDPTGWVWALTVHDDGAGPKLYAGGDFYEIGGVEAFGVACWDGQRWTALPPRIYGDVYALASFDDGTGPGLYVGGRFHLDGLSISDIARWNGQGWSALGSGLAHWQQEQCVRSLAVFDDGAGPQLYVGGHFDHAGGVLVQNIARWDGRQWSALAGGGLTGAFSDDVHALLVHDDGHGRALFAGGEFSYAGGQTAYAIARWDGKGWAALGAGLGRLDYVYALTVLGDTLYAGGVLLDPVFRGLARWDGEQWSPVGSGTDRYVTALSTYQPPGAPGPLLIAGGPFYLPGGVLASGVVGWDGQGYRPLASGRGLNNIVNHIVDFDDGAGHTLYLATQFPAVLRWERDAWRPVGEYLPGLAVVLQTDERESPTLYAGGAFQDRQALVAWDGRTWQHVGPLFNLGASVSDLAWYDDGFGPMLYAVGGFSQAGGVPARNIAKWDGLVWSPLGSGLIASGIYALEVFQGELYVGGRELRDAGGVPVSGLARWDGLRWRDVGGGVTGGWSVQVWEFAVYDSGTGPALYVIGAFTRAGSLNVPGFACWDGSSWSAVPGAAERFGSHPGYIGALDDGSGPALYVGGEVGLLRWRRGEWVLIALPSPGDLHTFDDGSGPAVYAGGMFETINGRLSVNIAKWTCILGAVSGDLNCDSRVDLRDINPFVLALSDPLAYEQRYPNCILHNADCNEDGRVDFGDITPFAHLLDRD